MKLQKTVKIISFVLLEGIILLSAGLAGMYNEQEKMKQEEQAETVENIAIVNLDSGVAENNKVRYYSQELMNLEADNLVSESLEAARQGIYNGSYAAYVIIPAEFSENAVSLNTVPEKATLEFAVNPNLREDVSRLTMSNIKNFEINLNTNMSYMYVQAILEEFHEVQDSSGIIMKNDNDEMARIMGIAPEGLMTSPEPMSPEWADPDIEDVDFDEAFETNSQISDTLRDSYDEFALQGEEAFELIKQGEEVVIEKLDAFMEVMMEIDIETDADGNVVYEQGIEDMSEYLAEREEEFLEQKTRIYNRIDAVIMATPTPTPTGTPSPGDKTPTPTVSPDKVPTPSGSLMPTVSPTKIPTPSGSPVQTLAPTASPEGTAIPTGTPTPEIKPIPLIIKETIDGSLQAANQRIEEHNRNDENTIQEIREIIEEIRKLPGMPQTIYMDDNLETESIVPDGKETDHDEKDKEEQTDDEEEDEEEEQEDNAGEEEQTDEEECEEGQVDDIEEEEQTDDKEGEKEQAIEEWKEEAEVVKLPVYKSASGAASSSQAIVDYLDALEELLDRIEKLDEMTVDEIYDEETIRQEFRNLAQEIEELPELNAEEYQGIFETSVLQPLQEEVMNENLKIQEEGSSYMEAQSQYLEELMLFDPYEYYDYEKMDEMMASFAQNIFDLEEKVYKSQTGYLELVYDTVDLSNESMDAMEENLNDAYDGTKNNIENEVDLAKQYRQEMNETNITILGGFKEKLPYTRVGNLEYVQAYDFMVKPVRMWDNSVAKKRVSFWQDYNALKNMLIVLLIIWCLSIFAQIGIRLYEDKKEDFEKE